MEKNTIAIFDLDGTITDCDTYVFFLCHLLLRRPQRILRCIHLPFAVVMYKLGMRTNTWLKVVFFRALAAGELECDIADQGKLFAQHIIEAHIRPGALLAIQEHKNKDSILVLASASFDLYTKPIAALLGFEHVISTKAHCDDLGRLSGAIDGENCYGDYKTKQVKSFVSKFGPSVQIFFYSDHHSDLELIRWANDGAAVNPSGKLFKQAKLLSLPILDWR